MNSGCVLGVWGQILNLILSNSSVSIMVHMTLLLFPDMLISNFSIRSHSEQFISDRFIVILEWTISLSQVYYQQLLRNFSILVVPDTGVTIAYIENGTLQLSLLYNTLYSVSITQPGICGQPNRTIFIELNHSTTIY